VLRAQNPPEQMLHGLEVIERNARTQTRIIQELLDARQAPADAARDPGNDATTRGDAIAPRGDGSSVSP